MYTMFILLPKVCRRAIYRHDPTYRDTRERQEQESYERNNPKIEQQFADLKRALGTLSEQDWMDMPDASDLTGRNKRARLERQQNQRFYAVPDSVLAGASSAGQLGTTVSDDGEANNAGGEGAMTNFADIGTASRNVLDARLFEAARTAESAVSGTATTIDSKGYLTSLKKSETKAAELPVGDISRARTLLDSVIKTNMKHGPGWIAAARLEELDGKLGAARSLLAKACQYCPKNEDVWLESIHLETRRMGTTGDLKNAKIIAKQAVEQNPKSVRLWIEAMQLENLANSKKRVLRKALDHIPQSVALWKEAVNLEEDPADARLMLAKATELIPLSVELWLALARLETPEKAQTVLNKARKACPTSYEIWIAAGRLQEQMGNKAMVSKVMDRAVKALVKEGSMLSREEWIEQAELCEDESAPLTCKAIVEHTLGWALDEDDDRQKIWSTDAERSINTSHFQTARSMYAYAIRVFTDSSELWVEAAKMEKKHGTKESLIDVLTKSVEACPSNDKLWIQLAQEKWNDGKFDEARMVLGRAFEANNNEDIWLAAVKLETENGETDKARDLLAEARRAAGTDRVWIKSVAFERSQANVDAALDLVIQALHLYPSAPKLWLLKGQLYTDKAMIPQAREAYNTGTRACPASVPLWLHAARLEEQAGILVKARSILDRARLACPKTGALWTETVRLERRAGNTAIANQKMAQGLQQCPDSGQLWTERIWYLEARTQRKPRVLEAMQKADSDPALYVLAARIFWSERKLDKAASWFAKAALRDPDIGDTWAWWIKFLLQHGTADKIAEVRRACLLQEPRHGEVWQAVRKAPENARLSTEQVLDRVVKVLDQGT